MLQKLVQNVPWDMIRLQKMAVEALACYVVSTRAQTAHDAACTLLALFKSNKQLIRCLSNTDQYGAGN